MKIVLVGGYDDVVRSLSRKIEQSNADLEIIGHYGSETWSAVPDKLPIATEAIVLLLDFSSHVNSAKARELAVKYGIRCVTTRSKWVQFQSDLVRYNMWRVKAPVTLSNGIKFANGIKGLAALSAGVEAVAEPLTTAVAPMIDTNQSEKNEMPNVPTHTQLQKFNPNVAPAEVLQARNIYVKSRLQENPRPTITQLIKECKEKFGKLVSNEYIRRMAAEAGVELPQKDPKMALAGKKDADARHVAATVIETPKIMETLGEPTHKQPAHTDANSDMRAALELLKDAMMRAKLSRVDARMDAHGKLQITTERAAVEQLEI